MLRSFLLYSFILNTLGCNTLSIKSDYLSYLTFHSLSYKESIELGFRSGRGVYVTYDSGIPKYLYHTIANPHFDGIGRWILGDHPGSNEEAQAFVDSWAVMPSLIHAVNDPLKSIWKYANETEFISDPSFEVNCVTIGGREDNTIYLEVRDSPYSLSGFYVQLNSYEYPIFSHVRSDSDNQFYLYKLNDRWIISESPGVEEGVAFVSDPALFPGDIQNKEWHYSLNNEWHIVPTTIIQSDNEYNVYAKLRIHRFIPGVPNGQSFRRLRNDLPIPSIGLGTNGILIDRFTQVAEYSLLNGYRLFDLSREYHNEGLLAELLHTPHLPTRKDIFIISKVWPTHLGFIETTNEIEQSLRSFQDPYIDMYMIQYPRCDSESEWMNCEKTVNPEGNLLQSYKSLERAYSEGRVGSIGVCNMNAHELDEMLQFITISPHAIQNHAHPDRLDMDVRIWASDHGALFFPIGYQRNAKDISLNGKEILGRIAYDHGLNEYLIMTKFFLQTGAVVTPGSTNPAHIQQNIQIEHFHLNEHEMNVLGWPTHDPREENPHASEL